jgi:hypothetical protein
MTLITPNVFSGTWYYATCYVFRIYIQTVRSINRIPVSVKSCDATQQRELDFANGADTGSGKVWQP